MAKAKTGSIRKKVVTRNGQKCTLWEGRVTVGVDTNGRQKQKSFYGATKGEVRQKMTAAMLEVDTTGTLFEPSKMTFTEWSKEWLEMIEGKVSKNTYKTYSSRLSTHIEPALGQFRIAEISKLQIQKFIDSLLKKKLAPKTIRSYHGVLSKMFEDAERLDMIKSNPAEKCTLPRVKHKEVKFDDSDVQNFLKYATDAKHGKTLVFILLSGLRESECLGLCWDCVSFKDNTIIVRRQLQRHKGGYILLSETKSHKPRSITISKAAMNILSEMNKKQTLDRFAAGEAWQGWKTEAEKKTSFCFVSDIGTPISHVSLLKEMKKIAEKMGRPSLTVHDLRHGYATLCLQNGDDLKLVSENLGHSTVAITADIYAGVTTRMKNESAERMDAFLERIS